MNNDERNFHAEALAILKGESRMIVQKEHLIAVAGAAAAATRRAKESERFGMFLAAVMLDNGAMKLPIPGSVLRATRAMLPALEVVELPDECVEVVLKVVSQTPAAKVN